MRFGYARVSTTEQNSAHQLDALRRVGVADDIHLDHASGAKASRPQLDLLLHRLQGGDPGRHPTRPARPPVLHLLTLGAKLRQRGAGLHVLNQSIDTATAEGRAMFGCYRCSPSCTTS